MLSGKGESLMEEVKHVLGAKVVTAFSPEVTHLITSSLGKWNCFSLTVHWCSSVLR